MNEVWVHSGSVGDVNIPIEEGSVDVHLRIPERRRIDVDLSDLSAKEHL